MWPNLQHREMRVAFDLLVLSACTRSPYVEAMAPPVGQPRCSEIEGRLGSKISRLIVKVMYEFRCTLMLPSTAGGVWTEEPSEESLKRLLTN